MLFKWFFFLHWIAIYVVCNIHMYPPLEWQTLLWDKLVNMLPGYNWLELKTIEFNCPTAIFKLIRIENTLSWSFAVRMHHSSAYSAYRHILSDVETRKKSTTVIQYVYIYHHGLYHDAVNPFQENLKPQLLQISRTVYYSFSAQHSQMIFYCISDLFLLPYFAETENKQDYKPRRAYYSGRITSLYPFPRSGRGDPDFLKLDRIVRMHGGDDTDNHIPEGRQGHKTTRTKKQLHFAICLSHSGESYRILFFNSVLL